MGLAWGPLGGEPPLSLPFLFPTSLLGPQCGKSGGRACGTAGLTPWLCTWDPSPARGRAGLSLRQPLRCRAEGWCWAMPAPCLCVGVGAALSCLLLAGGFLPLSKLPLAGWKLVPAHAVASGPYAQAETWSTQKVHSGGQFCPLGTLTCLSLNFRGTDC